MWVFRVSDPRTQGWVYEPGEFAHFGIGVACNTIPSVINCIVFNPILQPGYLFDAQVLLYPPKTEANQLAEKMMRRNTTPEKIADLMREHRLLAVARIYEDERRALVLEVLWHGHTMMEGHVLTGILETNTSIMMLRLVENWL